MATRKKFTIILPEITDSANSILTYGRDVSTGMTANVATFPTPSPTLAVLDTALDLLEASIVPEVDSSETTRNEVKKNKRDVLDLLVPLAAYVIGVAKGDRFIASLSNFKLSKEETTSIPQGDFTIKKTSPGQMDGTVDIVIGTRGGNDMFKVYRKVGDDWVMIAAFKMKTYTLTGLPSGPSTIRIIGVKSDVDGPVIETVVKAV